MDLSKDVREMGQRAAALSTVSIVIKLLKFKGDASHAMPILEFTGSENAGLLISAIAIASTGYFLLRVWQERLDDDWKSYQDWLDVRGGASDPLDEKSGNRTEGNAHLQNGLREVIGLIDFWLPVFLALGTAAVFWRDAFDLVVKLAHGLPIS